MYETVELDPRPVIDTKWAEDYDEVGSVSCIMYIRGQCSDCYTNRCPPKNQAILLVLLFITIIIFVISVSIVITEH